LDIDNQNKHLFKLFENRLILALWALKWAWNLTETNLRCERSSPLSSF